MKANPYCSCAPCRMLMKRLSLVSRLLFLMPSTCVGRSIECMMYGDIEKWALALDTGVLVVERDSSHVQQETEYYVQMRVCVCVCVCVHVFLCPLSPSPIAVAGTACSVASASLLPPPVLCLFLFVCLCLCLCLCLCVH